MKKIVAVLIVAGFFLVACQGDTGSDGKDGISGKVEDLVGSTLTLKSDDEEGEKVVVDVEVLDVNK